MARCPFCKQALPALMPPLPPVDLSRVPEGVRRKRRLMRMTEVAVAANHRDGSCASREELSDWLSSRAVARLVGRDKEWVRRRIISRKLAAWRGPQGHYLIHVSEVGKLRRGLVLK